VVKLATNTNVNPDSSATQCRAVDLKLVSSDVPQRRFLYRLARQCRLYTAVSVAVTAAVYFARIRPVPITRSVALVLCVVVWLSPRRFAVGAGPVRPAVILAPVLAPAHALLRDGGQSLGARWAARLCCRPGFRAGQNAALARTPGAPGRGAVIPTAILDYHRLRLVGVPYINQSGVGRNAGAALVCAPELLGPLRPVVRRLLPAVRAHKVLLVTAVLPHSLGRAATARTGRLGERVAQVASGVPGIR
jgi:hypothetical protein